MIASFARVHHTGGHEKLRVHSGDVRGIVLVFNRRIGLMRGEQFLGFQFDQFLCVLERTFVDGGLNPGCGWKLIPTMP